MNTTLRCRVFGHKPDYKTQIVEEHENVQSTGFYSRLFGDGDISVVVTTRKIFCLRPGCEVVMTSKDWAENPLSFRERYVFSQL